MHPDMLEGDPSLPFTVPPRAKARERTTDRAPSRPVYGSRVRRGWDSLLARFPTPQSKDEEVALRWLMDYAEWCNNPRIIAKREASGASIKQWELSQ